MKKIFLSSVIALLAAGLFTQCKKDDPTPEDENELITTAILHFSDGTNEYSYTWDQDGASIRIDTIRLTAGTEYAMSIELKDNSETPVIDITEEIEAEKNDHQFFYISNPANLLNFTYQDTDDNNLPIGLEMKVNTQAAAGAGSVRVILKHVPGVKNGQQSTGSTDMDISLPVLVRP